MKQPPAPRKNNNYNNTVPREVTKKQIIFQSRRRDAQKPLIDNSKITGMIPATFDGVFKVGKNGIGFVTHRDSGFVVMIETHHNKAHAINGDIVTVSILSRETGTGEISNLVRRGKNAYAGLLVKKADWYYFQPTDPKEPEMRLEPVPENVTKAVNKKVLVTLGEWSGDIPTCQLKEIIGDPGKSDTEILSIVMEKGFDRAFPESVEKEAQALHGTGIPELEIAKRHDMRGTTTFTIDPVDAKDFDDALSWKRIDDKTLEIGVHIADVSFYVRPGSALDDEAKVRTTSVYLVDRVIPMLPEVLSNELCSIRQDEDKLAFSTIFTIDEESGKIIDQWFGRTIIRSDKRFTYEEAQEIIDNGSGLFYPELESLMRISKIYTQERFKKGALSMDADEVRFILDDKGVPIRVMIKKRIDTMRMIEEWMLAANRAVAIKLSGKESAGVAIYRIHDKPAPDRVEDLKVFLKSLGYNVSIKDGIIPPKELQTILDSVDNDTARDTIQSSIVRSMAKAIYSTTNIGHFGLAFEYYTHFTSPIRRYPDVMVHRLLQMVIDGTKVSPEDYGEFNRMCQFSSDREKDAQTAEWDSIKYKQVEYMSSRIGQEFTGIITGLGKFGAFVAEAESKSDGMIRLMDLGNDFFAYNEKDQVIKGRNSHVEFRVGNIVKIKVKETNLERRTIDYVLVQ
jgi:ribonuclease R